MNETALYVGPLAALELSFARLANVAGRLTNTSAMKSPERGEWSPNHILWHVRSTADVYGEQIARMLDEDEPGWTHQSPRARMKRTGYDALPFSESFAGFAQERIALLARLGALAPAEWERFAVVHVRHSGNEVRLTVRERVQGFAEHEAVHCAQIERDVARVESGP